MSLHALLEAGALDHAAAWLLDTARSELEKHPDILKVLEQASPAADRQDLAGAISAYLLMGGDRGGAKLAYSAGLGAVSASKVLVSCELVRQPEQCYELTDLAPEAQRRYERVPCGGAASASERATPQIARLEQGALYGATYLPVTREEKACPPWFIHNPNAVEKLVTLESPETLPAGAGNSLLGCFDGVDEFDEGVLVGGSDNFGHWLLNCQARLAFVADLPALRALPLVVGEQIRSAHLDCLERFGYPASRLIRIRKGRLARFRRLWAPMMPFCVGPDWRLYWSPAAIDFLREGFGIDPGARPERRKRLYISRRGAKWRRLLNEDALLKLLGEWGFQAVDPGALSIGEQIDLAANAEAIVGPAGAGMNLLLFAPRGAKIVELNYHKPNPGEMNLLPALCRHIGQDCRAATGMPLVQGSNPLNYDYLVYAHLVVAALQSLGVTR